MKLTPRNITAYFFSKTLISLGLVEKALNKLHNGEFILSFYFHNPSLEEFSQCVKWLQKNNINALSMDELERILIGQKSFPRSAALITVDDGWQSNKPNIVEVAEKYKVPVTIFVSTEPVIEGPYWWSYLNYAKKFGLQVPQKKELKKIPNPNRMDYINKIKNKITIPRDALNKNQINEISKSKWVKIGSHTHTHPILPQCDDESCFNELQLSKELLEEWTENKITTFAYPNGDYSTRDITVLKKLEYKYAFTNKRKYFTKDDVTNHYEIPRFGILEGASFAENICRMTGVWQMFMKKPRIF